MGRQIIFYQNHFIEFYKKQDDAVKSKIQYVLELIKQVDRVPEKFLKHISRSPGLYKIRVEVTSNIYRVFCYFDEGRIVVLFNAFQKKSQKTPAKEIAKATMLMNEYYANKK